MAKSKNHTAHNQTRKAHRNGIKKPATNKYPNLRGVSEYFIEMSRWSEQGRDRAVEIERETISF
jgi:large subunit ribosomal protein L29e